MREQILAVQRMQEFIEEHLAENITLADLESIFVFSVVFLPAVYTACGSDTC